MRALWSSCFPEEKDREFIPMHFSITWLVQHKYYKGNFVYCRFYSLIFKGNSEMTFLSLLQKKKLRYNITFPSRIHTEGWFAPYRWAGWGKRRNATSYFGGNGKKIRKLFLHLSLLKWPWHPASKLSNPIGQQNEPGENAWASGKPPLIASAFPFTRHSQMKSMLGGYGRYAEFIFEGTGSTVFRLFPRINW